MTLSRRVLAGVALALALCAMAPAARAELWRDIGRGLNYAGFAIEGQHNYLSGGEDFRISRELLGNPLDFGSAEIAFQGPISMEISTGGRGLSNLDITFQTALTSDMPSSPLGYVFDFDVGGQETEVSGTIYLDSRFSLNGFGFYDLELTYSSRQDVNSEGRFSDGGEEYDFDIGPVNIEGNIFADVLAATTDPLFEAAGTVNVFESFSGRAQLKTLIADSAEAARRPLATDSILTDSSMASLGVGGVVDGLVRGSLALPAALGGPGATGVVPEPGVIVLMLLGVPLLMRRRR